jgi:hypothetical protein
MRGHGTRNPDNILSAQGSPESSMNKLPKRKWNVFGTAELQFIKPALVQTVPYAAPELIWTPDHDANLTA